MKHLKFTQILVEIRQSVRKLKKIVLVGKGWRSMAGLLLGYSILGDSSNEPRRLDNSPYQAGMENHSCHGKVTGPP